MPRRLVIPFLHLADHLRTGDVYLASGSRRISQFIKLTTWSRWSHVGMIVRPSDLGIDIDGDPPALWESTRDADLPDLVTGKPRIGAMLVDLHQRIRGDMEHDIYRGFAIRHLYVDDRQALIERLREFISAELVGNTTFPSNEQLVAEAWKYYFVPKSIRETLFCSQLVAKTYKAIHLLPDEPDPRSYVPRHFGEGGDLSFLERATLGPEIRTAVSTRGPV